MSKFDFLIGAIRIRPRELLPFLWVLATALSAGCASTGDSEQSRLTLAADKAALTDGSAAAVAPAPSNSSAVAVPLQGAIRRLVSRAVEAAAGQQGDSAGPRAAVVVPALSSGLQPPGLSIAGARAIAQAQLAKDFPGLSLLEDDQRLLTQADWAILMDVTLGDQDLLCVRVLDMNSGQILVAERQRLSRESINRVPNRYFRDLPVVLAWPDVLAISSPCNTEDSMQSAPVGRSIDWRARISLQMTFDQATEHYARRDHRGARVQFRKLVKQAGAVAAAGQTTVGDQVALHGRLGEYLSTWRMIFNRGAEHLMQPLIRALFKFDNELALNLSFSPVDEGIIAGRRIKSRQTEWLIEVSRYLRYAPACAKIVGYATNEFASGADVTDAAEPLGLKHAEYVRSQLRRHSEFSQTALISRLPFEHERMPIALTGDIRDEWARRVSIIKLDCREMNNEK